MGVRSDEGATTISFASYVIDGHVVTISILVEHMGMSVRERAALNILTGETNVVALIDKGGECKSLSRAPIDALTSFKGLKTCVENFRDTGMEFSLILRQGGNVNANFPQVLKLLTSFLLIRSRSVMNCFPVFSHPRFLFESSFFGFRVSFLKLFFGELINLGELFFSSAEFIE